jgi:histidine triad (HIT) family protein
MASLFTKIVQGEIPCHKIAENEQFLAFLDVFPLAMGHVLVIPKKEIDYFFDLSTQELSGILVFAQPIARAISQAFPCKKVGLSVVGLEVPHAHVHLVPMQSVQDLNFSRPKLTPSPEALAEAAERIRSFLS